MPQLNHCKSWFACDKLAAIAVATLFALVLPAILLLAVPWQQQVFLAVGIIFVIVTEIILSAVALDVVRRWFAKRAFAQVLTEFSNEDRQWLQEQIDNGAIGPRPFFGDNGALLYLEKWKPFRTFLKSEKGDLASQALLQRSPVGRSRYLQDARSMAQHFARKNEEGALRPLQREAIRPDQTE